MQKEIGPALVCVRHRLDALKLCRFVTVELVISARLVNARAFDRATVGLDLGSQDRLLRDAVVAEGARFDPQDRLWWLRGSAVRRLGLLHLVRGV